MPCSGMAGHDLLNGSIGRDKLIGGAGRDVLKGGKGADILNGGRGHDKMDAGTDSHVDVFEFNAIRESGRSHNTSDQITSFDSGEDIIDLSGIDANANRSGNQAVDVAQGRGAYSAWTLDKGNPSVPVRVDNDGDGRHDFEIMVKGSSTVTVDDVIL